VLAPSEDEPVVGVLEALLAVYKLTVHIRGLRVGICNLDGSEVVEVAVELEDAGRCSDVDKTELLRLR